MELFIEGLSKALSLIVSLDAEVLAVTLLSLKISCSATLASLFIGIPVGLISALRRYSISSIPAWDCHRLWLVFL